MDIVRSRLLSLSRPAISLQPRRFKSEWKYRHYYNVLRVKPQASPEEIRMKFLELVKIYHPDNPETGNETKFVRLKDSYDKIKEAPLWQEGHVGEDILTHEEFIKTRTLDPTPIKKLKDSTKGWSIKLYRS